MFTGPSIIANTGTLTNILLNFKRIQQLTQGWWLTPPKDPVEKLTTGAFDTRSPGEAQIFFAWKGEKNDSHLYLNQLSDSKIRLIMVERDVPAVNDIAILKVNSTLKALHSLASELAKNFNGKIINITGSSGKTTAKTWLKHILKDHFSLISNIGNFNNHIGCPITILNINSTNNLLILEMGSSGIGELKLLSSIAPADISLLLNVGHAHLGKFGSQENVYKAKTEIFANQREQALSLVPYSDPRLRDFLQGNNYQYFGRNSPSFSWETLEVDPIRRKQRILFHTPFGQKTALVNLLGDYVGELLSALIAICYFLGLSWQDIENKLNNLPQEKGRSNFLQGFNGALILDDSYNANPESVINMLKTLCSVEARQYIAVIGNLAELEENLKESAEYILKNIPAKVTHLILSGDTGKILAPLFKNKFPDLAVFTLDSLPEIIAKLKLLANKYTVIGVKGSRSAHMERIVYGLSETTETNCTLLSCGKLDMCKICDCF